MKSKKILIIEDNPTNLKLVFDVLTAEGYEVLQALDGETGLNIAQKKHAEINLILLDLKLPGIDGLEVIKRLKADNNTMNIPTVIVSAHAMDSDIKNAKEAGCYDYITKPINITKFLETVKTITNK